MLAMPWIATGSFVYQSFISSSKEWGPYVIAQSFMAYSILSVITLFISGFLIDKFSSRKLLIFMNIPLLLSTFVIIFFDAQMEHPLPLLRSLGDISQICPNLHIHSFFLLLPIDGFHHLEKIRHEKLNFRVY